MNEVEFKEIIDLLQQPPNILATQETRKKLYYSFNDVFSFLKSGDWTKENVVEAGENEKAVFQNTAEGYYRLGFIERPFFQLSRILYELWYEKTLKIQEIINERIHKGTQLHQIATVFEQENNFGAAWPYFFGGFIEDIIDERNPVQSQAFRALRRFNVQERNLDMVVDEVKDIEINQRGDPMVLLEILRGNYVVPSYIEHVNTDYIQLSRAKDVWGKLIAEEE